MSKLNPQNERIKRDYLRHLKQAIKYRKPGQAPKIGITAAAVDEKTIRLAIVDYGVGFKEEFVQTIFEPFKRLV
jgi:signal transduction histidine kinase